MTYVHIHNKHDRRMRGSGKFSPKNDWTIPVPKGETGPNKRWRLRTTGVSRTGVGIAGRTRLLKGKRS
jgi:hypothetical protein